jgi:hypothetical protein
MTITFKPGQHPDADQLSAFIEQALPVHERNGVLAHLAVCGDCRAVVAISLPEAPLAAPVPEVRRSWFSGWMVFMPAAAAVAALSAFIFFAHQRGPVVQQQAQNSPAPPPAARPVPEAQSRSAHPVPEPKAAVTSAAPIAAGRPQKPADEDKLQGTIGVVSGLSSQPAPAALPEGRATPAPSSSTIGQLGPGNAQAASQPTPAQQMAMQQNQRRAAAIGGPLVNNSVLPMQANGQASGLANGRNVQSQKVVVPQAAAQTVQVESEQAPIVTNSMALSSEIVGGDAASSGARLAIRPLPSGLTTLSSTMRGSVVLAIDTHHDLFVSHDSGQHWRTIDAVWKGQAVKVETIAQGLKLMQPAAGFVSSGSGGGMAPRLAGAKLGGAALTGTITDRSGAVVPGATVKADEPGTGASHSVTTDAQGRYVLAGLAPGSYDLSASAQGFMISHQANVAVDGAKENQVNFTLEVASSSQTVTVQSSEESISTTSVDLSNAPAAKARKVVPPPPPVFEIITDTGARWASSDGLTWEPR